MRHVLLWMDAGAPAGFLTRVRTGYFCLGGGVVCNSKMIIFCFVFYKVNLKKRLEHFLFVKSNLFIFFIFLSNDQAASGRQ